jgi:MoxR-like ATPase
MTKPMVSENSIERVKAAIKLLDIQDLDLDSVFGSYASLKKEADRYKKEIHQIRSKGISISLDHKDKTVIKHSWHETLATDVNLGRTVAIIGSSGNGKSYGVKHVLEQLGFNIYHMDCTDSVTVDQLVAGITPEPDGVGGIRMAFKEGLFARAFSDPKAAIQLDEYDALDPRVAMSLQSALHRNSKGRWLSCQDHPDGGIRAAGLCPVVVTMNTFGDGPTREYVGRNTLDAANKDRFDTIIITDYENEEDILASNGFSKKESNKIVTIAQKYRKAINEKGLRVILSTRRLINIAECVHSLKMSVEGAFERDFLNRLDHLDREALKDVLKKKDLIPNVEGSPMNQNPGLGSIVRILSKGNSHNYNVGQKYLVIAHHGSQNMMLLDEDGNTGNWIPFNNVTLERSAGEVLSIAMNYCPDEHEEDYEDEDQDDGDRY